VEEGILAYFKEWPALLISVGVIVQLGRMYAESTRVLQEQNRYTQEVLLKAFVDQTGKVAEHTNATRELTAAIGALHTSQEIMKSELNRLTGV
jgi:hypothetical protein